MTRMFVVAFFVAAICLQCFTAAAKEPIKIGVFLPMTGNVSAFGQMEWLGIKTAHQMMGKILGREVKLILEDTKSDQTEAAHAVERLIKQHQVVGIIGGAISGSALAGGSIAERNGIPMISPSATNLLVTQDKKYVFRACFDDSFQSQVAARQARIAMGASTAAVVVDIAQADYSVGLGNLFLKAFGEMGGKVLLTAYIQTGDRDFRSQLSEVREANPDIIYVPNYYTENALLVKQARDLGMKMPILMADGAQVPTFIETGGKAVEGVYLTAHFNLEAVNTDLGRKYAATFKKNYDKDVDAFSALGADAYFILIGAIKRAKSTEGAKVRTALTDTKNFKGVTGPIKINEDGNTTKRLVINRVKNGRFTYVTTVNP
ncbi:MAG: ABC transporter substrate-binding protein [Deltaproteobacteria bacterium]|nr:ABC transporter substrate-binding protein [Deltaproteobacteria bacterium]MDH3802380.1 ABC transporter substrate-binding protein [Deltaproteobacteria bacterium]MDH3852337.1 ABC transporter substrate-binding protein [Deltaproteobacteria bacterium]MDH3898492.1 ABC transporter substrate-binding protein [Deltaproteobacteria bacterium]MDH3928309.1 ABC transporter substrate-binding protein [Deltaproteobacteria bacterium]